MNPETTLTVLEQARELIADEQHWCQGADARDSRGRIVDIGVPRAQAWCALGAIGHICVARNLGGGFQLTALIAVAEEAGIYLEDPVYRTVPAYNDTHTHGEVLELFDRTIARLRGKTLLGTDAEKAP